MNGLSPGDRVYWIEYEERERGRLCGVMKSAAFVAMSGTWTKLRDVSTGREWSKQRYWWGHSELEAIQDEVRRLAEKIHNRQFVGSVPRDIRQDANKLIELGLLLSQRTADAPGVRWHDGGGWNLTLE